MPNTEKQLTAVMMLRDLATKEIAKINTDATFETKLGAQICLNSEQRGRIIALQQVIDDIDTDLLATERQQLIDFYNVGRDDKTAAHIDAGEDYFRKTFNPNK